ncbi:MAG: protease, partial [Candidatus Acidiferrum sp.]
GKASAIWLADLADSRIEKIPRTDSNDWCPMWLGNQIYFISDRDGPVSLYHFNPQSHEVKQALPNNGYDLVSATAGPDAIVYEQFGSLNIFDPKSGQAHKVDVKVSGDFPNIRPHWEKVGKKIRNATISPNGARAAFEARGEILTVPAEKGDARNLTATPAAVERYPSWSPDGKSLAYFSDESGEYMLYLRDPKGKGPITRIALGNPPNHYSNAVWSPDCKKIAYGDNRRQLWLLDIASRNSIPIAAHTYFGSSDFDVSWSPNSQWLVYTKVLPNRLRAAFLYEVAGGKTHQLTDGMSDVRGTTFDKGGKYLYFTASTDIGPSTNGIDMSGMNRPVTRNVYIVVLSKDTPSPLAPESDEEKDATDVKPDAGKDKDKDKDKDKAAAKPET